MKPIKTLLYTLKRHCYVYALLACGCGTGCEDSTQARFTVVATTGMIGDAMQHIVQDRAQVITLMGPGVDPHAYEATARDLQQLLKANVVFYNGLYLEGKMAGILQKLSLKKHVYAAGDALAPAQRRVDPNFSVGIDPHIWFDVGLWKQAVRYMSNQLQAADPAEAAFYEANTTRYLQRLDELHEATQQAILQIPPTQRVLITAHDAFGYFGQAYGMEVRGLQGISTVSECGLKDITDLVEFIVQCNIKAVFLETSVPDRSLRAVVEGCSAKKHAVTIGGYLYSDALGQAGTPEGTYYGMVQANVQTIVKALK